MENGVSFISEFFQSLENLFTGQEPALHKKSLFGRFSVLRKIQDNMIIKTFHAYSVELGKMHFVTRVKITVLYWTIEIFC